MPFCFHRMCVLERSPENTDDENRSSNTCVCTNRQNRPSTSTVQSVYTRALVNKQAQMLSMRYVLIYIFNQDSTEDKDH